MSGSGGGGGGGSRDYESPCDKLRFEAQLTSPQPAVVSTLKVGDILDVKVVNLKGQIVVQVLKKTKPAGGLAGPDATRLRNCVEQGHEFKATVRKINGGQVRVLVEHV